MSAVPTDLGDKPKLTFAGSENILDSPIRLVPDEGDKENAHVLENDDEEENDKVHQYKRARIEYSSPEKIEMLNSLSPIKIDTEGNAEIEADLKNSVATAIEEAVNDFKRDSKAEEDEEEAFGKRNSGFLGYYGSSFSGIHGFAKPESPAKPENHESMSPIMVNGTGTPRERDVYGWEKKFEDLSSEIYQKHDEIVALGDLTKQLRDRATEAELYRERDRLEIIKLEHKSDLLSEKLHHSEKQAKQYDDLNVQFEALNKRFEACKQKLKEVKIELTMTNQNNHILSEKFEKEYAKFAENENLVNEWKTKHDAVLSELSAKGKEMSSINEELRSLKELYEETGKKLSDSENQLQELRRIHEEETTKLRETIDRKASDISELNEKLNQFQMTGSDEISSLKTQLQITETELNGKKIEIESLHTKASANETAVQNLRLELSKLTNDKGKSLTELEQTKRELESLKSKNVNVESEHLAELEKLHANMLLMETNLKENVKTIVDLNSTIKELEGKLRSSELDNNNLKTRLTNAEATRNTLSTTDNSETDELRAKIKELEETVANADTETNKKLQLLAEDLYIQYSSKHEQKVKMLKKGYETKYKDLLDNLTVENNALHDEVDQLQKTVETERAEKQDLIKSLEN
ncbi:unnamed protein product [Kluyveromyces dobzhanskii CBS 2104]|uniref:WGS project CCBQ000000000 data, contig 00272 n=1 Tax=Kluyveromyces dobzhanskii CBS 2104 TaxID=1427455 RepID=A0A0A8LAS0_9SACH|nr:unnamed protein product [Kluyveromyces dobzhanskii CBS 2104]